MKNKTTKKKKNNSPNNKNKTKKNNCKNNSILEPFEKQFSKTLKPTIRKANDKRIHNLNKIFSYMNKYVLQKSKISPQNDFYGFVNDIWIKNENLKLKKSQDYIAEVDDFRLLQYKIYNELDGIIKKEISEKSRQAIEMKNYYNSAISLIPNDECKKYAKNMLTIIEDFIKKDSSPWNLLGYMNNNEMIAISCPLYWKVSQDLKNVNKMQSYISSPEFSLPNTDIYFDIIKNKTFLKKSRRDFIEYVDKVFKYCFGENNSFNAKDVFDVEKELIMSFSCKNIKEPKDGYSQITTKQAIEKYNFDWDKLSKAIGFSKTPDYFITTNLAYLKCGTDLLLKNWNTEKWKTYWIFIYIKQLSRFTPKGKNIYSDFYAKIVVKEKNIIDKQLGAVILTTYAFNTLITHKYVDEYSIPENIEYTKTLCNELKIVFTRIIERSTWLQPITKKYALLKLKNFKFHIGKTGVLPSDPILKYNEKDIWYNLVLLAKYRHNEFIKNNNKLPVDFPMLVWSMYDTPFSFTNLQAYVVNASYTPSKNAITIPVAYMQNPFINLNTQHSFEYNLAHIGFTIGHEMSHALDDWGSKYDYNGNLNYWWTPSDEKQYKGIQNNIINQYETWAKRDGINYDAYKTVGEDLADISGISTVIEYLLDFQYKNKEFPPITSLVFKNFFIFYAYQMRQYETKWAFSYQLKENVHPPNKYRTNVPLSRTPLFREIYNINKSDDMFWNSTDRVWQK